MVSAAALSRGARQRVNAIKISAVIARDIVGPPYLKTITSNIEIKNSTM
jgi:hypothetical protein